MNGTALSTRERHAQGQARLGGGWRRFPRSVQPIRWRLSRASPLQGKWFPAILSCSGAPLPRLIFRFFLVAYGILACSRLGCSPKMALNRAYHSTSRDPRCNTNRCLDKKTRGLPNATRATPPGPTRSPARTSLRAIPKAASSRPPRLARHHIFPNFSFQKGIHPCLIFVLPCLRSSVAHPSPFHSPSASQAVQWRVNPLRLQLRTFRTPRSLPCDPRRRNYPRSRSHHWKGAR